MKGSSESWSSDFFQLTRLMLLSEPDRPKRLGEDEPPSDEAVRFVGDASLAFPAVGAEIDASEGLDEGRIRCAAFGLFGFQGALPDHDTRTVIERDRDHDEGHRDFLDLFNHRLTCLFYRAWEKYRFPVVYERTHRQGAQGGEEPFGRMLLHLIGWNHPRALESLCVAPETLTFYAGLLLPAPRSLLGLQQLLADYFGVSVRLLDFQGRWLELDPDDRTVLPKGRAASASGALGVSTIAGARVWDVQSRFLVRLGPLDAAMFRKFLPGESALRELVSLVDAYIGPSLEFCVQPVLRRSDVPPCALSAPSDGAPDASEASQAAPAGPRLGFTSFLLSGPAQRDADDVVLSGGVLSMSNSGGASS